MKFTFASHKSFRSYKGAITFLISIVVLAAGFMVMRGRASGLGIQWPASLTRTFAGRSTRALNSPSPAPPRRLRDATNTATPTALTSSVGDVAVDVANTTIKKLNEADGTVAWSVTQANDGALAVDQGDLGVYTGNGHHSSGSGTVYKYNAAGGLAWTGSVTGAGCNFYYVNGAAVDTTSGTPGVVFTETSCFGGFAKSNRTTGVQQWSLATNDVNRPSIDPADGRIYDITLAACCNYKTIYSVATTGGAPTSAASCEGNTDLNPADGMLYRGGNMGSFGCGLQLSQLNKSSLATPNWSMTVPGITSFDALAVQPWSGGYIYVASANDSRIVLVNPATQTVVGGFSTAVPPNAIAVSPNGGTVYVASSASNFVYAYSPSGTLLWTSPDLGGPVYNLAAPRNLVGTAPNECDYCVLQSPSSTSVSSGGTTAQIFGRIFESGVTPPAGSDPSITAQVGFGPLGSDPRSAPGWSYFPASFNTQVGNDDEYVGTMTAPVVGVTTQFSYTYRFSFDSGANWSYADLNGAGTNVGLTFDTAQLGTMTVTATAETNVVVSGGNLLITDDNGGSTNDTLTISVVAGPKIRVNDPNNTLTCGAGLTQVNANTCEVPQSSVTGNIQVDTLGGNDALTLNFAGGNLVPSGGLIYNGGAQSGSPGDSLTVTGGVNNTITHTLNNANDGSIQIDTINIQYTGLEPVTDNMSAVDRVFTFTGGSEAITLADAAGSNMTIDSTLSESVTFANPTGSLTINAGTGDDTVTISSVDAAYNVDLTINGDDGGDLVNLNTDITFAAGENLNVDLTNDAGSGDVDAINVGTNANHVLSGSGAATLATSRNIALAPGSSIITANGALTLSANQQVTPTSGIFFGIDVNAATVQVTGNGTLALNGKGGNVGGIQIGVHVRNAGVVQGGSGALTVQGTGGAGTGTHNYGVDVTNAGSTVTSSGGSVQITGQGGGSGTATFNIGVIVDTAAQVTAGGSGTVTVHGTGGASSGDNNYGVFVSAPNATITSGGGNVQVTGIEGVGSSSVAILTDNSGSITTATNGGTVTLIGNSMSFVTAATISAQSGSSVTLRQRTNGVAIDLGAATDPSGGPIGLTDAELDLVTAGTLNIGNASSGAITVSTGISRAASTILNLTSGNAINLNASSLDSNGGNVKLSPGTGSTVNPAATGVDVSMNPTPGTLSFASDLGIAINGTTVDTQYQQLNVVGAIDLTGVTLVLSGSHTPVAGQTFTIVNNDSTDLITGTFAGLLEGATIPNFLGSTLDATITYVGGADSNDVVLTVLANVADLSLTKTDSPDPVTVGNALTYTLTVSNAGPDTATNVVLTDTLPGSVSFVSATPSQGSACTGTTTITCNLGSINNGANATVQIVVTPNSSGSITNNASATATEVDSTPATDSEDTLVNAAVCTSPPAGMVAWYPGDGNADDIQGPTFENGTLQNGATFASGKVSQAFSLNGTNQYVNVASAAALPATFTLDAWVNPTNMAGAPMVFSKDDGVSSGHYFQIETDGKLVGSVRNTIGDFTQYRTNSPAVVSGRFQHIAMTYDGSAGADLKMTFYVDGVNYPAVHLSTYDNGGTPLSGPGSARLGIFSDGTLPFAGLIDEFEQFNRVLSGSEIGNIYNASFAGKCRTCTPAPSGMVSWYSAENSANDIYGTNNGTFAAATYAAGKVGQGFSLDGNDDYVSLPNIVYGSNFSVDAWIKTSTVPTDLSTIVEEVGAVSAQGFQCSVSAEGGHVGQVRFYLSDGTNTVNTHSTTLVNDNAFHHVACVKNGSTAEVYVDGALSGTGNVSSVTAHDALDGGTRIGALRNGAGQFFQGLIDEVEIFNRALTATEIAALADAGNAGKCHTSTLQFDSATYNVTENGVNATITVTRTGAHDTAATIDYATVAGGTATGDSSCTAGTDYQNTSGTLNFGINEVSKTFNVPICDDAVFENAETVNLQVSNVTGAGASLGTQITSVLTITDNDAPPSFTIDDVTHNEGNSLTTSYVFTVTKTGSTEVNASVQFQTNDGSATLADSDYQTNSGTLNFTPAQTTQQITVLVNGDTTVEPDEAFTVHLFNPLDATITDADGTGTITNDDIVVTISGRVLYRDSTTGAKNVTMTLTAPSFTTQTTTTDTNGDYSFTGVPTGNDYTVTPSKTGDINGIESLDASNVARYVAGLEIPTPNQRIAADADGDTILTSLDAALIARRVAGLPGFGIVGTWKFVPVNRTYLSLAVNQTNQDFTAILVGDTSGNWLPALPSGGGDDNVQVNLANVAEELAADEREGRRNLSFGLRRSFIVDSSSWKASMLQASDSGSLPLTLSVISNNFSAVILTRSWY